VNKKHEAYKRFTLKKLPLKMQLYLWGKITKKLWIMGKKFFLKKFFLIVGELGAR